MIQTLQQIATTLTAMILALQAYLPPASQTAQVAQMASLSLSPSSQSVAVNNTFTVNIILNTGGSDAYGADVNKIHFNPSYLQVVDSDSSAAGVQIAAGALMSMTVINTVDNTAGTIQFSQLATPGSTYKGSGTLATITFRAVAAGSSSLTFDFSLGSGTDCNVAGLGGDLLGSVSGGSYTGNTSDVTPPTISGVSSGNISQSGATIVWTTNEPSDSQVEYGLTSSYGSQSALNSSLVTSHSVVLSGLSAGKTYHYKVKSRDAAGNLAASSDNVFTTQTLPDTTAPTVPTGLTAVPTSESQIQVSWNASTDPSGAGQAVSGVSDYQVYRGGSLIKTTTSTAYLDTGLAAGTNYSYQVAARDAAGNISAKSSAVSTSTPLLSVSVQRKIVVTPEGAPVGQRSVSGTMEFLNPLASNVKVYQASFTTNSSGECTIDIPAGLPSTVTFRPVVSGYLAKNQTGVDLMNTSIVTVNMPIMPAGDFNNDQLINSLDFSYMNTKWNSTDSLSDINRDGIVNSLDFAYLSNNWMQTGE